MPDDVKIREGNVTPSPASDPTKTGQPSVADSTVTPNPEGDQEPEKTVPLAALHAERDRRQSLQAELEALRQIAGNQVLFDINGNPVQSVRPAPQGTPQPGDSDAFQRSLDQAWEEDPRKAVEMTIGSALQWRDDLDAAVDSQEQEVASKHQDFEAYRNDVRKYIRTLPMAQRGNPGVAEMAYFVVKGQKSGNVYTKAQAELLDKIRKGEQVSGLNPGTNSTPAAKPGVQLTEEQLRVADMMNLTPEQYKSAMK